MSCDTSVSVFGFSKRYNLRQLDLAGVWLGLWPVNSPLWVQQLTDDGNSHAIRDVGELIYAA